MSSAETQSAWNLSQADIIQMAALSQRASTQFLKGNIQGSYFTTTELRTLLHTYLNAEEDKNLDLLEKNVARAWNLYLKVLKDNDLDEYDDIKFQVLKPRNTHAHFVKKYRRYIRELLGKYGFLFGEKEDSSKMF